jgi:hypothetical protein
MAEIEKEDKEYRLGKEEKQEEETTEQLADKKKQEEMEKDLAFMKGRFEMARAVYPLFMKLSEQLAAKTSDTHRLTEVTSEIFGAMIRPLEAGETRDSMLKVALDKHSIGIEEVSAIKKLANNPNVDMATGISEVMGFLGHKYANTLPTVQERAFFDGIMAAKNSIIETKDNAKESEEVAKPTKGADDKRKESQERGAKPTTNMKTGKSISVLSKEAAAEQERDKDARNTADRKDNSL